jgi:membrane protein
MNIAICFSSYRLILTSIIKEKAALLAIATPPKRLGNDPHTVYTAVKRLFHSIVVCSVIALIVALVLLFQQYQQDWLTVQTRYSGESLARQYAKLLQPSSNASNAASAVLTREHVEKITAVLAQEPHILSLSVFDKDGRYLAPLPKIESVVAMSQSQDMTPLTFVEPIIDGSGVLMGYVNIHMDTQTVLESPLSLRYQLVLIACILVCLALLMGIYVTRGFYKFRPWIIETIETKRVKKTSLSQ